MDEQLGELELGQPRLDQLPQPPLVDVAGGRRVDDEVAVPEARFGLGVAHAREALEKLGLLAGERAEPFGAVDGPVDRLRERSPAVLQCPGGEQETRGIGVPAAVRHPDPAGSAGWV